MENKFSLRGGRIYLDIIGEGEVYLVLLQLIDYLNQMGKRSTYTVQLEGYYSIPFSSRIPDLLDKVIPSRAVLPEFGSGYSVILVLLDYLPFPEFAVITEAYSLALDGSFFFLVLGRYSQVKNYFFQNKPPMILYLVVDSLKPVFLWERNVLYVDMILLK